jgi:hypothetical protein
LPNVDEITIQPKTNRKRKDILLKNKEIKHMIMQEVKRFATSDGNHKGNFRISNFSADNAIRARMSIQ